MTIDSVAWSNRWRDRAVADKCFLAAGLVICAALLPVWPGAVLVSLAAVAAAGVAGVPLRHTATSMRAPMMFIVAGVVSVALTITASPHWWITITREGLERAGEIAGHSIAGTLSLVLLASTTPMSDLLTELRRLRVPAACVDLIVVMYRMVFILLDSLHAIRESQTARLGYTTVRGSIRSAGLLTAGVLIRSWDRARRLENGLAGREFGNDTVSSPDDRRPSSPRFLTGTAVTLVAVILVSVFVDWGFAR
jgi:cobalt/nickel transport system permease protein